MRTATIRHYSDYSASTGYKDAYPPPIPPMPHLSVVFECVCRVDSREGRGGGGGGGEIWREK